MLNFTTPLLLSLFLSLALSGFSLLFFFSFNNSKQKTGSYECGFDSWGIQNTSFSVQFFMMIVLFLIFDLELVFLFPTLGKLMKSTLMLSNVVFILFLFMIVTTLYEWFLGTLEWKV